MRMIKMKNYFGSLFTFAAMGLTTSAAVAKSSDAASNNAQKVIEELDAAVDQETTINALDDGVDSDSSDVAQENTKTEDFSSEEESYEATIEEKGDSSTMGDEESYNEPSDSEQISVEPENK